MLVAAAVCPHPPLLLPGLTGASDVLAELRAACRDAVGHLIAARPDAVVAVGGAERTRTWDDAAPRGVARFGGRRDSRAVSEPGSVLPLSLAVGQHLLDASGWAGVRRLQAVAGDARLPDCSALGRELVAGSPRVALLVLGDGSARRGLKAPGYLDPRAAEFDEQVRRGLAGDPAVLATLDPALAGDLLVAGRAPWQVLAGAAGATSPAAVEAEITYAEDPFGVFYVVARWTFRSR